MKLPQSKVCGSGLRVRFWKSSTGDLGMVGTKPAQTHPRTALFCFFFFFASIALQHAKRSDAVDVVAANMAVPRPRTKGIPARPGPLRSGGKIPLGRDP